MNSGLVTLGTVGMGAMLKKMGPLFWKMPANGIKYLYFATKATRQLAKIQSLRFGGFFANDLINKTVAFHIFSKADTLLENDFQMALRVLYRALMAPEPTILAFNTPDTQNAATEEPRIPILPSSTASDFDESSSCNGTSCVQLNLVNGCPYKIFVGRCCACEFDGWHNKNKKCAGSEQITRCATWQRLSRQFLFLNGPFDADGKQTFDVSYVDGANVPISVHVPNCSHGSVIYDYKLGNSLDQLVDAMPDAMKMVDLNGKKRVKSVCLAYGTDSVCCRNAHDQPTTCGPTHNWTTDQITGYNAMLAAFPTSYSYAYDDANATRVCWHGPNFRIGFCTN
uniref:Uncharacterized protein n=1 Tax=Globodera rostochiensis TaxID=31243 RepID=A0A914I1C4_GLORO